MRTVSRTQPGTSGAANGTRGAVAGGDAAVRDHERGLEALEVVEHDEVGAVAGRDRAEVGQAVAAGAGAARP